MSEVGRRDPLDVVGVAGRERRTQLAVRITWVRSAKRHGELGPLLDEHDRHAPRADLRERVEERLTTLGARPRVGSSRRRTSGLRPAPARSRAAAAVRRRAAQPGGRRNSRTTGKRSDTQRERLLDARPPTAPDQTQPQVLFHGELAVDAPALGNERDPARAICSARPTSDRRPANLARTGRRCPLERGASSTCRRRSGRSGDDLAARDPEAEPANRADAAVAHLEPLHPEHGRVSRRRPPRLDPAEVGRRHPRVRRISSGVPSASVRPWSSTWTRSHTAMIRAKLWSMSRTPAPWSPRTDERPPRTPAPPPQGGRRRARPSARTAARRRAPARLPAFAPRRGGAQPRGSRARASSRRMPRSSSARRRASFVPRRTRARSPRRSHARKATRTRGCAGTCVPGRARGDPGATS